MPGIHPNSYSLEGARIFSAVARIFSRSPRTSGHVRRLPSRCQRGTTWMWKWGTDWKAASPRLWPPITIAGVALSGIRGVLGSVHRKLVSQSWFSRHTNLSYSQFGNLEGGIPFLRMLPLIKVVELISGSNSVGRSSPHDDTLST